MVDYGPIGRVFLFISLISILYYIFMCVKNKKVNYQALIVIAVAIIGYSFTTLFTGGVGKKEFGFLRIYTPFTLLLFMSSMGYLLSNLYGLAEKILNVLFIPLESMSMKPLLKKLYLFDTVCNILSATL
jgi:hypothetical protein